MTTTQPLAEVFGFPLSNQSPEALRHRKARLCPYHNVVANCTKDKANEPLGVCSIFDASSRLVITCPVRFREAWYIAEDAANFFFPAHLHWTSLSEVRLNDQFGKSAGNIDLVLVAYDERGRIQDFGALEVQAVYISGNVRRLFEQFMRDPAEYASIGWVNRQNLPRPDYLSSSRKRLVPQLIYKGGILHAWHKKQAVAVHRGFFETLPSLPQVSQTEAEMVWLVYDLVLDQVSNVYRLTLVDRVYTLFRPIVEQITTPNPGQMGLFVDSLQEKLDAKFSGGDNPPDVPTLFEFFED